jgi:protein involved in polysaccharide export with SLBB domain
MASGIKNVGYALLLSVGLCALPLLSRAQEQAENHAQNPAFDRLMSQFGDLTAPGTSPPQDSAALPQLPGVRPATEKVDPASLVGTTAHPQAPSGSERKTNRPASVSRSAEKPSAFQKFIFEDRGVLLPVFGADFFATDKPAADNVPVPGDYIIGPGDGVNIHAWGSVDINYRASVDRDGNILIPRMGTVTLAGLRADKVQDRIAAHIGKYYKDFRLDVSVGVLRGITIYLVGQVANPGSYTVSSLSTVVSALSQTGGIAPTGSLRQVTVMRGGRKVATVDLYAFLALGDKSKDTRLLDGDTLLVPPAGAQVALMGAIGESAIFELLPGEDLAAIVRWAGGLPVTADPRQASIERLDPTSSTPRSALKISLDAAGLREQPRNGDLITVFPILPEFGHTVTLRGAVAQPLRVPFVAGMRISDLIPGKHFLITRAALLRQNQMPLRPDTQRSNSLLASIGNLYDELNWEYALVERPDRKTLQVTLLPFHLGNALDDPQSPDNLELQAGDRVSVFSANDIAIPMEKRRVLVEVSGEVQRPGIYQAAPGENLADLLHKAGGLTPQAFLYGAAFYRRSVSERQQANLGKVIARLEQQANSDINKITASSPQGDDRASARARAGEQVSKAFITRLRQITPEGRISMNLKYGDGDTSRLPQLGLENADRLIIPSRPSEVMVQGAVNIESTLLWEPGRTVGDYLRQAGYGEDADTDQVFVLHADGSAVGNGGRWFSSVLKEPVYPGDIIVAPTRIDQESGWATFTRYFKDYTSIFYNLGLGAAAIHTLKNN